MYRKYFFILNVCNKIIINKKKLLITILNSAKFFFGFLTWEFLMNKSIFTFVLSLIFLSTTNLAYADDHQPVGPAAVEMLACNFND